MPDVSQVHKIYTVSNLYNYHQQLNIVLNAWILFLKEIKDMVLLMIALNQLPAMTIMQLIIYCIVQNILQLPLVLKDVKSVFVTLIILVIVNIILVLLQMLHLQLPALNNARIHLIINFSARNTILSPLINIHAKNVMMILQP